MTPAAVPAAQHLRVAGGGGGVGAGGPDLRHHLRRPDHGELPALPPRAHQPLPSQRQRPAHHVSRRSYLQNILWKNLINK